MSGPVLYLASASPRRLALLQQIGIAAQVCVAAIDETPFLDETAQQMAVRLAFAKARAVALALQRELPEAFHAHHWVLGADTTGIIDNPNTRTTELLMKPQSKQDAFRMWHLMANSTHEVLTAIALVNVAHPDSGFRALSVSEVAFGAISDDEMEHYWATGEPQDKAGAYAIQGYAACWVKKFCGSYSGIVGLPLYETKLLLEKAGFSISAAWPSTPGSRRGFC